MVPVSPARLTTGWGAAEKSLRHEQQQDAEVTLSGGRGGMIACVSAGGCNIKHCRRADSVCVRACVSVCVTGL